MRISDCSSNVYSSDLSHFLNVYFDIKKKETGVNWRFVLDVLDADSEHPPLVKVQVNQQAWTFRLEKGSGMKEPGGDFSNDNEQLITLDLPDTLDRKSTRLNSSHKCASRMPAYA